MFMDSVDICESWWFLPTFDGLDFSDKTGTFYHALFWSTQLPSRGCLIRSIHRMTIRSSRDAPDKSLRMKSVNTIWENK